MSAQTRATLYRVIALAGLGALLILAASTAVAWIGH